MIALLHGYRLTGSGSNLWTRNVVRALCAAGETVHLVCQEPDPAALPEVAAAYRYDRSGARETVLERSVPGPGRCIVHRPWVGRLPVYVRPVAGAEGMAWIPEIPDDEIGEHLAAQEAALRAVLDHHPVRALAANHVVLQAVAARRVATAAGLPYAVIPHGSAMEYTVRHDERMHRLAAEALADAARVFVLSPEMRRRIAAVFPAAAETVPLRDLPLGVDAELFGIVPQRERGESIERLLATVAGTRRGRTARHASELAQGLAPDLGADRLQALLEGNSDHPDRAPDEHLEASLARVDWECDEVLLYVGRLLGHKGVPGLVAALPPLLRARPNVRLVLAGPGPLRRPLEALVHALGRGWRDLAETIVACGGELEGETEDTFTPVAAYWRRLDEAGELDRYFSDAAELLEPDRVVFTGYLEHAALRHLYPCADLGLFPSLVREAGPLVALEAMACGVLPAGTDHAGMSAILDLVERTLGDGVVHHLRLSPDPERTVASLVRGVPPALDARFERDALRRAVIEHHSWHRVARTLLAELTG